MYKTFFLVSCLAYGLLVNSVQAAQYTLHTVADGLNYPWCIAFLPDGNYLVSMRAGELRIISSSGDIGEPIANTPETYVESQGGYFDVALDPDFSSNQTLYLAFAHGDPNSNATRVIRATLVDNGLEDVTDIFTVKNPKDTAVHYGGKLQFVNDGTLFITTGDGFQYREAAQDRFGQLGKVIRINKDGSVPSDNPHASGENGDPKVYAYGIRSPQGLAYDATTDTLYLHDHGPRGGDELNLVKPDGNYGWPVTTHGVNYSGAKVSPFTRQRGIVDPIRYWTPSIAPSGMTFYDGEAFPQWRGDLFLGALADKDVRRIDLENGQFVAEETLFEEIGERIRDIRTGPDGLLYILTDSDRGKVIRVAPK